MKKRYVYVLLFVFAMLIFTSCSSEKSDMGTNKSSEPMNYGNSDISYDNEMSEMKTESALLDDKSKGTSESPASTDGNYTTQNVSTNRKLIKKVYLDLQTLEFNNTLNFILGEVKTKGGYIENSNIQGNAIYENSSRSAKLVIRIPSELTDEFVNIVGENATIISRNEETKDITKEFVDTESHIKMLQIEQERLLSFLEKAESLKDMITLEDRLGEVRYELEGYASTLKTYENLVEYSTLTISIYEVKEIVEKIEKQSTFSRMGSGLYETVTDIGNGFTNFFVWFVINLPYLLIWAILITTGVVIGLKVNKKNKAKLQDKANTTGVNKSNGNDKNSAN